VKAIHWIFVFPATGDNHNSLLFLGLMISRDGCVVVSLLWVYRVDLGFKGGHGQPTVLCELGGDPSFL
jgi:hypothetical protein